MNECSESSPSTSILPRTGICIPSFHLVPSRSPFTFHRINREEGILVYEKNSKTYKKILSPWKPMKTVGLVKRK